MSQRKATALIGSLVVIAALAAGGYWWLRRTEPESCSVCRRMIHAEARAVIEVDARREPVCCARCALTLQHQQHKPVRLVEVTDYVSRRPLAPADAYFVEGSAIVLCERHQPLLGEEKQPYARVFDRCVPSLYAFARREDAEAFAAANGGAVRRLPELLTEAEARP